MAECQLPKLNVEGSIPFSRSKMVGAPGFAAGHSRDPLCLRQAKLRVALFSSLPLRLAMNPPGSESCLPPNYWRNWSGRRDLNPGPFDPQSNALPGCATPR